MENHGFKNPKANLAELGLGKVTAYWNLEPAALIETTLRLGQGHLADTGALVVDTGEFKGRSPSDRYIVKDDITADTVDWGPVNIPFDSGKFDRLYDKVASYLNNCSEVYVRDAYACANLDYKLNIRVVNEHPWQNMFAYNMFLRPTQEEIEHIKKPDWHILAAPGFMADAAVDGTRQHNFAIINFTRQTIIIGGTAYTGEIKKGIFSVLNYLLPLHKRKVLSMHCSANVGEQGDTALFFGLSGTGKTTLSTDPKRKLIGDDEHGWSTGSVFNFEGGCYAKTIDLSASKEPEIYNAIKFGALLENVTFFEESCKVNYEDDSLTQNTRVSYPIHHIKNRVYNLRGDLPKNIFFLTCDAFGVLPPISKLNTAQTMYHFISGYTAKVAGTEDGIDEPLATFSACFGLPFMPLHPTVYAELLGAKVEKGNKTPQGHIDAWLVNTGWSGGPYGVGRRMDLAYTRAMISAALEDKLKKVDYVTHPVFGLEMPTKCPDVPNGILNPVNTWLNEEEYYKYANLLADKFVANFKQFEDKANDETLSAAPKIYEFAG